MKTGDIIFMVVVIGFALLITILKAILKGNLPKWLGFILMLVASLVAIIGGAATGEYKAIPLGVAGVIGTIVAWASGATSQPTAADDTLGGVASNVPWWSWLIIAGVVVAAVVLTIVLPTRA